MNLSTYIYCLLAACCATISSSHANLVLFLLLTLLLLHQHSYTQTYATCFGKYLSCILILQVCVFLCNNAIVHIATHFTHRTSYNIRTPHATSCMVIRFIGVANNNQTHYLCGAMRHMRLRKLHVQHTNLSVAPFSAISK